MKKLHQDGILQSLEFESFDPCEACLIGKIAKTPFNGFVERASDLLEIIHSDVCGPMSVPACSRFHYFVTFIDDLSRYAWLHLSYEKEI
jgi:hypothetical protein